MTGDELRSLRDRLGLSQSELAELLNATLDRKYRPQNISGWETGARNVPADVANLLPALALEKASASRFSPESTPSAGEAPGTTANGPGTGDVPPPPLPSGAAVTSQPVLGGRGAYAKTCEELWGMIGLLVSSVGAITGSGSLVMDGQIIDADKAALGAAWGKLAETNQTFQRMLLSATTGGAWVEVGLVTATTASKILANHRPPIEGNATVLHPVPEPDTAAGAAFAQ